MHYYLKKEDFCKRKWRLSPVFSLPTFRSCTQLRSWNKKIKLRRTQNYNDIIVTRIWSDIDGSALPILGLLAKNYDSEAFRIALEKYLIFKILVTHQDEDDFDVSDWDSIIDIMICERSYIRVVNTMIIIENLPIINADLPNSLLSCFVIRNNFVVYFFTSTRGKIGGRYKGGRNKSTID